MSQPQNTIKDLLSHAQTYQEAATAILHASGLHDANNPDGFRGDQLELEMDVDGNVHLVIDLRDDLREDGVTLLEDHETELLRLGIDEVVILNGPEQIWLSKEKR